MESEWIQIRLRRTTRERLRAYGSRVQRTTRHKPINRASESLSPEQCVSLLLDSWEGRQERVKKGRKRD